MKPLEHHAERVVQALLGDPDRRHGEQWRFGSLAVNVGGPAAGQWWDDAAGEGGDLAALVRRRLNGQDPGAWLASIGIDDARLDDLEDLARPGAGDQARHHRKPVDGAYPGAGSTFREAEERMERARTLFAKTKPLAEGSAAWRYVVEHRGLPAEAARAALADMRVVPAPISGRGKHEAGLMSLIRDASGQVSAFQLTFIHGKTGEGSRAEPRRRTYATRANGARDGLFHAGGGTSGRAFLCEGYLEKPLAAAGLGLGPTYGWGGRKVLGFALPPEADVVVVPDRRPEDAKEGEDHDRDYRRGCARLASAGKLVWMAAAPSCPCPCKDADDLLRRHGPDALRSLLENLEPAARAATGAPIVSRATPRKTAQTFIDREHRDPEGEPTLVRAGNGFWAWGGQAWRELEKDEAKAALWAFLDRAVTPIKNGGTVPVNPKAADVAELAEALKGLAYRPYPTTTPAWLAQDDDDPPAHELVAMQNGLLHVPTRRLLPHTPRLFTPTALPFDFDPDAPTPDALLAFLRDLWAADPESSALCQEMFGYAVSGSNALQKIMLMIGPARAGKGTLARLLTHLLGTANVVAPTLGQLTGDFGLSSLIGKTLAIIGDARLSRRSDPVVVVERMLTISGADQIDVNRKHRDYWTGTLPCRLLMLTNELPLLSDTSGTLASRFVPLAFTKSFLGHEDTALGDRLAGDLPGTLNWALGGLDRINLNGRFTLPERSRDMQEQLTYLSSAVLRFVDECCLLAPTARCPVKKLYERYCDWRLDLGLNHASEIEFGRDLKAARPEISNAAGSRTSNAQRTREYVGICPLP